MKVYLAARYSRIAEMRTYRAQLERVGHVVTSRWVDGKHEAENREAHSVQLAGFAQEDCDDVKAADCVISFTEAPRGGHSRGGRHVEHGMALAWNKRVVVIGHRENVFHSMPQVEFFETWRDAYCHLIKEPVAAA
jgi:hypothetical protein